MQIPNTGFNSPLVQPLVSYANDSICTLSKLILAIVVNNHRVLHGRSAFTGKRRMCGAYIGIDEYRSKLAVLTEKFRGQDPASVDLIPTAEERSVWSPSL